MRILAMEPYYGGSHKAFLDGWIKHSRHDWHCLTLPANKWKWRMRHAAITMARAATQPPVSETSWDLLFCSDMLNLAEFLGLAPPAIRDLPSIAYFHENQVTYPVIHEKEYDYHFAFSNLTTALAATQPWFNSAFHRNSFLDGLQDFLKRMPDHQPLDSLTTIRSRSEIRYPGITPPPPPRATPSDVLRILWCARWEYDKGPETFFEAMDQLASRGVRFELSIIGGWPGRDPLPVFQEAEDKFKDHIVHWGYLPDKDAYHRALCEADVTVSTADHEFFGISMLEAMAAGAYPLLPNRLAYPEVLTQAGASDTTPFLYDGSPDAMVERLSELAVAKSQDKLWQEHVPLRDGVISAFSWERMVPRWDDEVEEMAKRH